MAKEVYFEWDDEKDKQNQNKHGVSFAKAQYAFADYYRVYSKVTPTVVQKKSDFIVLAKWMKP